MTVLILSKMDRNEYETNRLVESFLSKNVTPIVGHPDNFDIVVSQDLQQSVKYKAEDFAVPGMVLTRLGAGILPFQLAIIRQFEQMNVPCVNQSESINVVRDKLRTGQILAANNLPIPKTMMVRYPIDDGLIEKELQLFVGYVDAKLLEAIFLKIFESKYIQQSDFMSALKERKRREKYQEIVNKKKKH